MNRRARFALALANLIAGQDLSRQLAAVSSTVDDSTGWHSLTHRSNERDAAEMQQQYTDALTAWRKNPIAKRIIDTTSDYCLGDGMTPSAPGLMGRDPRSQARPERT